MTIEILFESNNGFPISEGLYVNKIKDHIYLSVLFKEKMVRTNSVGSIIQSTPGGPAFKKNYGTAYDDDSDVSSMNSKI